MDNITHLIFTDLVTDREPSIVKLTPRMKTWGRLASRHVADLLDSDVLPGAFGIDGPSHLITARFADGREEDVTVQFIGDGWASWRDADEHDTYPGDVPAEQVVRARRVKAFWATPEVYGEDPEAEADADAEYEAALAAELAEMARAAAETAPSLVRANP